MPILPKQLAFPYAKNGDKNDIPNTANLGNINYSLGWDQTKEAPLNLGGTELERRNFNGLLYDVTDNIYAYQKGVKNYWRQYVPGTEQTTQEREIYAKGSLVWINKNQVDDSTALLIVSKTDNNTEIPVYNNILSGSENWAFVFDSYTDVVLTRGTRIIKGINETTMKGFLKLDGSIITEAEYNAIPSDIRPEITVVDTSVTPNIYKLVDTRGFDREIYSEEIIYDFANMGGDYFLNAVVTKYSNGIVKVKALTTHLNSNGYIIYFYYDNSFLHKDTQLGVLTRRSNSGSTYVGNSYIYTLRNGKAIFGNDRYGYYMTSQEGYNFPSDEYQVEYESKWYENRDLQANLTIVSGQSTYVLDLDFTDGDVYGEGVLTDEDSFYRPTILYFAINKKDYKLIVNARGLPSVECGIYDPETKTLTITRNLPTLTGNYYIYGAGSKARFTNVQQILLSDSANMPQSFTEQGYVLPPATDTTLGGVIAGEGLSVSVDGTLSITSDPSFDTWIVGTDPLTLYIKYSNGELRYYKKFNLPSGFNNNYILNMTFEEPFFIGVDLEYIYTIRIISFRDITTGQVVYSQRDFIHDVESNPNMQNPLTESSASLQMDKRISSEGYLFLEIKGFWKDPTA